MSDRYTSAPQSSLRPAQLDLSVLKVTADYLSIFLPFLKPNFSWVPDEIERSFVFAIKLAC
jgi:hypothetical protein